MGKFQQCGIKFPTLLKLGCESVPKLRSLQTEFTDELVVCLLAANTWTGNRHRPWKHTNDDLQIGETSNYVGQQLGMKVGGIDKWRVSLTETAIKTWTFNNVPYE